MVALLYEIALMERDIMKRKHLYASLLTVTAFTALASASAPITINAPFDYSEVATEVALAAGAVLALTFGWMIGFRLVKTVIGRLAGQA